MSSSRPKKVKKGNYGIYRSNLERRFSEDTEGFAYEPRKIPYVTHRHYLPDFEKNDILIECKGFFRIGDTQKYKAIRDTVGQELIFLLSDRNKKIRKGAKMTMGQWCDKEGFKHFILSEVEELMTYVDSRRTD